MAGFLAIFIHKAGLSELRSEFERAFSQLFHCDPARDEFYCRFSEKLQDSDHPSSAIFYQYSELSRFAGEPRYSEEKDIARPGFFIIAMGSGIETMFELIEREMRAS